MKGGTVDEVDTTCGQFWIDNFPSLGVDVMRSPAWTSAGTQWCMEVAVMPLRGIRGTTGSSHGCLGVHLKASSLDDIGVNTRMMLSVPSPIVGQPVLEKRSNKKFCQDENEWGIRNFCSLQDVERYMFKGGLQLRVELRCNPAHPNNECPRQEQEHPQPSSASSASPSHLALRRNADPTISSFFDSDSFCDVVISAQGGQRFNCHRLVLAAASRPLSAMLGNGMVESTASEVNIPNYCGSTVRAFLKFVYGMPVEHDEVDDVSELLRMADQYEVRELASSCRIHLLLQLRRSPALNMELCCSILAMAGIMSAEKVHEAVVHILLRLRSVMKHPAFTYLSIDAMRLLLTADPLRAASEKLMLEAALKWVEADMDARWQHLEELAGEVRFYGMCHEELKESRELVHRFVDLQGGQEGRLSGTQRQAGLLSIILSLDRKFMAAYDELMERMGPKKEVKQESDMWDSTFNEAFTAAAVRFKR